MNVLRKAASRRLGRVQIPSGGKMTSGTAPQRVRTFKFHSTHPGSHHGQIDLDELVQVTRPILLATVYGFSSRHVTYGQGSAPGQYADVDSSSR